MKKTVCYTYLGDNGTLLTTIHIEGAYGIKKYMLSADEGKMLTKDGKNLTRSTIIPEADLALWYEVDIPKGQI